MGSPAAGGAAGEAAADSGDAACCRTSSAVHGRLALALSSLRCGACVYVDQQLGGGPDEEQGVHASQHPDP